MHFLKKVARSRKIVGFDVVEMCPNPANKAPDFVAAKVIYQLLSYISHTQSSFFAFSQITFISSRLMSRSGCLCDSLFFKIVKPLNEFSVSLFESSFRVNFI